MAVKWPQGVLSAGVASGVKTDGAADLGLLVSEHPVEWAGVFTRNAAAAAPVNYSRSLLGSKIRVVVANSGNANACTGQAGEAAVADVVQSAAASIGCPPEQVLVASTGPIGVQLPGQKISAALPAATRELAPETEPFARAILTTDTRIKRAEAPAGGAVLAGVAKGAAMIAPNMATMLAFLVTDAQLTANDLQRALGVSVDNTFNRISVDACESTNDTVLLLSTGVGPEVDPGTFGKSLELVCANLAEQIVRDAEGGTKLVRIQVRGAADDAAAAELGRAVAASALWRAAVGGGDPNWGRVVAALGAADRSLVIDELDLTVGEVPLFVRGTPTGALGDAARVMAEDEFGVKCVVGSGPGRAEVLSADLTSEYVGLNAEGTA